MVTSQADQSVAIESVQRWWVYQRERFPVAAHGALIGAFSFSAVSFSALLRGARPSWAAAATAFIGAFLFFLLLRISDEFKDCEEDARYRPYRPVPRGLVTLRELGVIGMAAAAMQLAATLLFDMRLVPFLLLGWLYLGLMGKEFFAPQWLGARPVVYAASHMVIVPLIDLYAMACDWVQAGGGLHAGVGWFLAVSYCNGVVVEIGRKLRAPQDEEFGVQSYTALWGRRGATAAWLGAMAVTGFCALMTARQINFARPVTIVLLLLLSAATIISIRFLRCPTTARAKPFEAMSGVWTLLMYLSLGAIPLLFK